MMSWWEILALAVGVSFDALAVSVAGGLVERGRILRNGALAALAFGGFQFLMPVAGYLLALPCRRWIAACDHWIALILLVLVGGNMLREAVFPGKSEDAPTAKPFSAPVLLAAAVATSLDALAVGVSLVAMRQSLWIAATAMGIVTGVISFFGVVCGAMGRNLLHRRPMSALAGIVIILIGIKIFYSA